MTDETMINEQCNPLDAAEDFLHAQQWNFDRLSEDQLYMSIDGDRGNYKVFLMWDERQSALQLCCEIEVCMPQNRISQAHKLLADVNSDMWLGHFDLSSDNKTGCLAPCFRYTSLIRTMEYNQCISHVKDLVNVMLQECERLHNAFSSLDRDTKYDFVSNPESGEAMDLMLAQSVGQC